MFRDIPNKNINDASVIFSVSKMENVTLSKEAVDRLKKVKKKEESLSDVILRITDNESRSDPSILKSFEGIFEDSDNWEEIEKLIYKTRLIQRY